MCIHYIYYIVSGSLHINFYVCKAIAMAGQRGNCPRHHREEIGKNNKVTNKNRSLVYQEVNFGPG